MRLLPSLRTKGLTLVDIRAGVRVPSTTYGNATFVARSAMVGNSTSYSTPDDEQMESRRSPLSVLLIVIRGGGYGRS